MSNLIYRWKSGSRLKGDPVPVAEALERIRAKNDGLKPGDIVREAKRQASVLHQYFEWNDDLAAKSWRIEQAKYIVRCLVVVHVGEDQVEDITVRAFMSVNEDDDRSYESIARIMEDPELRERLLQKATGTLGMAAIRKPQGVRCHL